MEITIVNPSYINKGFVGMTFTVIRFLSGGAAQVKNPNGKGELIFRRKEYNQN